MANSLFHKDSPDEKKPPTPYELIEKEVEHLKKGTSVRHGGAARNRKAPWLAILAFMGLAWLYLMDPFLHAWYKGEAIRVYLYLHQYGSEADLATLVGAHLLSLEEIDVLNHKTGSFREYYNSADDARKRVDAIVSYTTKVQELHAGNYQPLDPVGRMRCVLFVRLGLVLPTDWIFLDPTVTY
jgi:hypothetical protein